MVIAATELQAPEFTEEERERITDYFMALRKPEIQEFLANRSFTKTGTKAELRNQVLQHIRRGELTYADLVGWLDRIEPWGKQHVFLYEGPASAICDRWRDEEQVFEMLADAGVDHLLNSHLPLILPSRLTLSAISYSSDRLRVAAVERRDYYERQKQRDESDRTSEGNQVELRAYVHHVSRGLVSLEWNLVSNTAMLQVSQLPSGTKYEETEANFSELVRPWLDMGAFEARDISRAINRLHEAEEAGTPEARSHAIDYATLGGRRLSGKSASSRDSLLGEDIVDRAMADVRVKGVGHRGNFYWLPPETLRANDNPLAREVHVFIEATSRRIRFSMPNREEDVRYILRRIWSISEP